MILVKISEARIRYRNFSSIFACKLLLETAVIALIWVMIQLKAFLTPLLATVLQLKEQFNQPS